MSAEEFRLSEEDQMAFEAITKPWQKERPMLIEEWHHALVIMVDKEGVHDSNLGTMLQGNDVLWEDSIKDVVAFMPIEGGENYPADLQVTGVLLRDYQHERISEVFYIFNPYVVPKHIRNQLQGSEEYFADSGEDKLLENRMMVFQVDENANWTEIGDSFDPADYEDSLVEDLPKSFISGLNSAKINHLMQDAFIRTLEDAFEIN